MANEKNIIMYFPFDETNGSKKAFDYSPNRADGVVNNAEFVGGKVGNAIKFEGEGTVDVSRDDVITSDIVNGDWTLMAWINASEIKAGSPTMLICNIAFEGVNKMVEKRIAMHPGSWHHVAIVKLRGEYKIYFDTILIDTIFRTGIVTGVSLSQDYFASEYAKGMVDDMKVFNVALTYNEIVNQMSNVKMLEYSIDGINLKDMGITVSASKGLTDRPKMKKPYSESWADYHGSMVDLNHKYLEDRVITLDCFIKTKGGKGEFVDRVNKFLQIFDKNGTHRLMVDIHPTKPLVYEVYLQDTISFSKTWNDDLMVGTFTLKLIEPSPVKKVLKYIKVDDKTPAASIRIKTDKYVDIYWGDGYSTPDVGGDAALSHEYKNAGNYYIVIAGCIDEIISFETNAIIVWEKI